MSSSKNSYVFKYDKHKNLYNYAERDNLKNLLALYTLNYKKNLMLRYDKDNNVRVFTQFDEPCKLVQKFEAGESWVKSVPVGETIYNYQNPKIKKQFALNDKDQLVSFGFQQDLIVGYSNV